jgi:hypothetical protein
MPLVLFVAFVLLAALPGSARDARPVTVPPASGPPEVETLRPAGGLPAHIAGRFLEPVAFARATTGESLVLDRRAHAVYIIDASQTVVRQALEVGFEQGQVLSPNVLSLAPNDFFAVADAPTQSERIQYFSIDGMGIGAFWLRTRFAPRITIGSLVLSGVGSMHFTGRTFLVNRPETGGLFSELDLQGRVIRHIGTLRRTGHERDQDVHLALNVGLPLVDPRGGYYFVFLAGVPLFQKYNAQGRLLFERHIEGVELDALVQALPTTWPTRTTESGTFPIVPPLVRTAAVDPAGRLWVSLAVPFTYVFDPQGFRIRTIRFEATGVLSPTSLFFASPTRLLVTPGCYEFETS